MHVHTPSDIPKQKPQRLRVPLVPQDNGGLLILSICFPSKTHINLNDEIVSVTLSNCSNLSETKINQGVREPGGLPSMGSHRVGHN